MKKIVLLLSVIMLAFTSCSKSEGEPVVPIDQSANILLKKAITTKGSTVTTDEYFYNERKIDKIVSDDGINNGETRFTYTGDLITKIEVYSNTVLKSKKEYSYQNDKMTQIITYDYNGTQTIKKKETFIHTIVNTNQEMAFYKAYAINMFNNQETIIGEGEISLSGNYVISQFVSDYVVINPELNVDSFAEYTYNYTKNPTINIIGYDKLFDSVLVASVGNMANRKFSRSRKINGVWTPETINCKRRYTYNENLFPNQRQIFDKSNILDTTTEFLYQ